MIATITEIKNIIGIDLSDTSLDSRITALMPIVEEQIHDICKNHFVRDIDIIESKYLGADTISFDSSTSKILDSGNSLGTFIAGNSIKVFGSLENDGIYYVSTVSGTGAYLTIDTTYNSITTEAAGQSVSIYKLWYPKPLKFAFAGMLNYILSEDKNKINVGIQSEKVDDYSVSYNGPSSNNVMNYGYPLSIITSLGPYRKYY
jgi:hypothetical protein